jgi:hypothetical protein
MIEISPHTRNGKVLRSFVNYCIAHPSERFWQALLNWSGCGYIFASGVPLNEIPMSTPGSVKNTYYWEGRTSLDVL